MTLCIHPLQDFPQHVSPLVQWHHGEWRKYSPSASLEKRQRRLQQHLCDDPIPQTFIALLDGELVGSASVVFYHFGPKVELIPWLTNVYVAESLRDLGFGSCLVEHAERYVAEQGFASMRLFTVNKKGFYLRRGWTAERKARMSGYEVDIMGLSFLEGCP